MHSTYQLSASTSVHAQEFKGPNFTFWFQLNDINKSTTNTSHTFGKNATRNLFTFDSYYCEESKLAKEVSHLEKKSAILYFFAAIRFLCEIYSLTKTTSIHGWSQKNMLILIWVYWTPKMVVKTINSVMGHWYVVSSNFNTTYPYITCINDIQSCCMYFKTLHIVDFWWIHKRCSFAVRLREQTLQTISRTHLWPLCSPFHPIVILL